MAESPSSSVWCIHCQEGIPDVIWTDHVRSHAASMVAPNEDPSLWAVAAAGGLVIAGLVLGGLVTGALNV